MAQIKTRWMMLAGCSLALIHCAPAFHADQAVATVNKLSSVTTSSGKILTCDTTTSSPGGLLATKSTLSEGFGSTAVDQQSWLAHSSVMLTIAYTDNSTNEVSLYVCTAMLLDRDVILTAAHCVAPKDGQTLLEIRAFFDSQPECNSSQEIDYSSGTKTSKQIIHPDFTDVGYAFMSEFEYGDLAMLKMTSDAPATWSAIKLSAQSMGTQFDQILAAGYGHSIADADAEDPAGLILRFAYLSSISSSNAVAQSAAINQDIRSYLQSYSSSLSAADKAYYTNLLSVTNHFAMGSDRDFLYTEQSGGKGICTGDSGSAAYAFRNGKYYVVAVASFVGNSVTASGVCAGYGAFTQVLRYRTWIESTFAQLKKSTSAVAVFE